MKYILFIARLPGIYGDVNKPQASSGFYTGFFLRRGSLVNRDQITACISMLLLVASEVTYLAGGGGSKLGGGKNPMAPPSKY